MTIDPRTLEQVAELRETRRPWRAELDVDALLVTVEAQADVIKRLYQGWRPVKGLDDAWRWVPAYSPAARYGHYISPEDVTPVEYVALGEVVNEEAGDG